MTGFFQFHKPRSLSFKFSLATGIVFLIIFAVASFILIDQSSKFQKESLIARANTFTTLATKPLGDAYKTYFNSGNLKFRTILQNTLALNNTVTRAQFISVTGELLFDSNDVQDVESNRVVEAITDKKVLEAIISDKETKITGENGDITEVVVPYSDDFGGRPFSIRYFISYESIYQNINQAILITLALVVLLFLTTLVTVTLLVNRSIISPLSKIIEAARDIRSGNLEKRIELNAQNELDDLALSLNQMTTTLQKNIEGLKEVDDLKNEFILIASHNLRTPLTAIKGYLLFLREKKLDKTAMEMVGVISENTQKLEVITESLLNIVTLEKDRAPLRKTQEDLVEIVREVGERVSEQAQRKKVALEFVLPEKATVVLDRNRITQAVLSVVDNAVKFNKDGGQVIIKLVKKTTSVELTVTDSGIGIAEDEQGKIFQKFHRGTDMLTYNYEGIGLGLYLTNVIIESHQGQIEVKSTLGKGTIVKITLPTNLV